MPIILVCFNLGVLEEQIGLYQDANQNGRGTSLILSPADGKSFILLSGRASTYRDR